MQKAEKIDQITDVTNIHIFHNNNAEQLFENCEKNNCPINSQVTSLFFQNEFIEFS